MERSNKLSMIKQFESMLKLCIPIGIERLLLNPFNVALKDTSVFLAKPQQI